MSKTIPVVASLVVCEKCRKPILVERVLIGIDHTLGIIVTCWNCLTHKQKEKAKKKYSLRDRNVGNKIQ